MKISNFMKARDIYGHPTSFNFNSKGDKVNTAFGGFCTIIVQLFTFAILCMRLDTMLTYDNDNITQNEEKIELEKLDLLNLTDTNLLFFYEIRSISAIPFLSRVPVDFIEASSTYSFTSL